MTIFAPMNEQMTARQMIELLKDFYPDEKIALCTEDGRYLIIAGVNERLTQSNATPTLNVLYAETNKPVETQIDALEREKRRVEAAIIVAQNDIRAVQLEEKKRQEAQIAKPPKKRTYVSVKAKHAREQLKRYYRKKEEEGFIMVKERGKRARFLTQEQYAREVAEGKIKPRKPKTTKKKTEQ